MRERIELASAVALEPPKLLVRQTSPLNAGPTLDALIDRYLTPADRFFTRNHGTIPDVDPRAFRLHVGGRVRGVLDLGMDDLRERFPARRVTATLQCAGNRRRELSAVRPIPGELEWGSEAIGTAEWEGIALRDVLESAGLAADAAHVALTGLDTASVGGTRVPFGVSIPLEKALSHEVLLSYGMNGAPLPKLHGAPLRAIVPGYVGARSVKWLARVDVLDAPSENPFQANAYRMVSTAKDPPAGPIDGTLGESEVTSAICTPEEGAVIPAGRTVVRGYAYAGGRRLLERVEVSAGVSEPFAVARLQDPPAPWAWSRWQCDLELEPGPHEIVARAFDTEGGGQPAELATVWNPKGYANNAWPRVRVHVVGGAHPPEPSTARWRWWGGPLPVPTRPGVER